MKAYSRAQSLSGSIESDVKPPPLAVIASLARSKEVV
ncbi:uncharacterized protein G2W53_008087 [Senna tora]|uniref:Uncharacterized protein n=1 Tax=Senna tora TaxID=362788 RepID=A0A834X7U4_9FABA|nr:uncharacterized protein G2W53_008087 [Senna tora]